MTETPQTAVDEFVASTTGGAREPKTVTLSDGSFVVAYSTPDGDGSGFEIRGQLFDQNGNKIGAEFLFDLLDDIEVPEFDIASMGGKPRGDRRRSREHAAPRSAD